MPASTTQRRRWRITGPGWDFTVSAARLRRTRSALLFLSGSGRELLRLAPAAGWAAEPL